MRLSAASAWLKSHVAGATGEQPVSTVPALRGSAPEASVVKFIVPYGVSNTYGVFGHRPLVTFARSRAKVIWSPSAGAPFANEPSMDTRNCAVPGDVPPHPGVLTT